MQGVELRHMRCLVVISEELNFTAAAKRLGSTQSAISQLLQRLEDLFGQRLVERDRASVRLTALGETVVPLMRRALAAVDQALEATQRSLRGDIGRLRLGLSAPSLYSGGPAMIRTFRDARPDVTIEMVIVGSPEQPAALLDGRLDIGFGSIALDDPALDQWCVGDETMRVLLPRWHRLAACPAIQMSDLAAEPWIMPSPHAPLHRVVVDLCHKAGFEPHRVMETADFSATLGLLLSGSGITLVAESFKEFAGGELVLVPLVDVTPRLQHFLTFRQKDASPIVAAFLAIMKRNG